MKVTNDSLQEALENLEYTGEQVDEMMVYLLGNNTLHGAPHINHESLIACGIISEDVEKLEKYLKEYTELRNAFGLLSNTSLDAIGNTDNPFSAMGFTQEQYVEAQNWILGHGTFEGAPHIKDEHLPIFDCSNKCGAGSRHLRWQGHVNMVAAIQPFISGAASKTVNVPKEAGISVMGDVFDAAHKQGIKCITIYRDGAKYAQPLSSVVNMDWWHGHTATKIFYRGERRKPLTKRMGFCQQVTIYDDGKEYKLWIQCFEYPDGTLCEMWLDVSKENPDFQRAIKWWTRAISNAIQYGQPLSEIAHSFILEEGGPSGRTDHPYITTCKSIPDFVFRFLALEYLGDTTWARKKPPMHELRCGISNGNGGGIKQNGDFTPTHIYKTLKYTDTCPVCNSRRLQLYPCPCCKDCGAQIGDCSV
jgi:ribonucleoside-diphosphate reductase alpha chain